MRFWPRRLTGQLALVVALALLVAQIVSFALLARAEARLVEAGAEAIGQNMLLRAADAMAAESPLPIERAMLRRIGRRGGRFLTQAPPPAGRFQPAAARRLGEALAERGLQADAVRAVRVEHEGDARSRRALALSVRIDGGWLTATVPVPRRDPVSLLPLAARTALIYVLVLLPVLWIGRRISRPLGALTEAVRGYRVGAAPIAFSGGGPEGQGPEDVRALAEAIGALQARIVAMLAERDALLGAIGHDLRTPVTSLRLRAEQVQDTALREKMIASLRDTERMLEDTLALARSGAPAGAPERLDVALLVRQAAEEAQAAGQAVRTGALAEARLTGHSSLLRRAVQNLIANADRYAAGGTLTLACEGGEAVIAVRDDGPGIPEGEAERMTAAFARGEGSRSRATGGAGLGLAIARRVAEAHGGRLTLQNRPGGGLEAALRLPLTEGDQPLR